MAYPILASIVGTLNYSELPENWRLSLDAHRFSENKVLYDYQRNALESAAKALFLYFNRELDQQDRPQSLEATEALKSSLYHKYLARGCETLDIARFETRADETRARENPVFQILSNYLPIEADRVRFCHLINRMGFWMATGSGKTLVMIKLIEFLHRLIQNHEIPDRNFLILAPSDYLLSQIKTTIDEFNQTGLFLDLVPLTSLSRARQGMIGDVATVYYHRSDNMSAVQKEALIDFRRYENDGKWYVFLDEAHRGSKEDSKRQAYYTVMAREGFLFNFSATFTDAQDMATTVKKFNLEEFVGEGYGKRIYLNQHEFNAFSHRNSDLDHEERRKVVLKSLLNLAFVSTCVQEIRNLTGNSSLYHLPLMLTLVNTVNTKIDKDKNDLWAFFETLRDVATGKFNPQQFASVKNELIQDWKSSNYLFGKNQESQLDGFRKRLEKITIADLCRHVFLSEKYSALQIIRSKDNKEIAIQMKNADAPFALIRIGQTANWRTELLIGYEETLTLKESSYFSQLEKSSITILMGSRSFFESWDSNRPNVISFINIGGIAAKKFVVQSIGRGVRIEPLLGKRRRHDFLSNDNHDIFRKVNHLTLPIETLFLYATNRKAVKTVLEGLTSEKSGRFQVIEGFAKAEIPKLNGSDMTLLVPEYRDERRRNDANYGQFGISTPTLERFRQYLKSTSDAVFLVRDGLPPKTLKQLRNFVECAKFNESAGKKYDNLKLLLLRLVSHMNGSEKLSDGVRELDAENDIVHFRQIRTSLSEGETRDLAEKLMQVAQGDLSDRDMRQLAIKFSGGEISPDEFKRKMRGLREAKFKNLTIRHIRKHYYLPVVLSDSQNSDFIQHIISEKSEVEFIEGLESWLTDNKPDWDAWMFSKIDEHLDSVHIPYYNERINDYARFKPDFIFWMCKGNNFQIVFVDPKGTVHKSAYLKIDGFMHFFESENIPVKFKYKKWNVLAKLLMFNDDRAPRLYQRFWSSDYADIFSAHG